MNSLTLSIITINKNNLHGLQYTLKNLEKLGFGEWEHIIVDACSEDNSDVEITRYIRSNPHFKVVYIREPDEGIWDAMNKGAGIASALYLLFLNSGDELVLDIPFSDYLGNLKSSRKLWQYGSAIRINAMSRLEEFAFDKQKVNFQNFIYGADWIPHGSTAISAKLFRELGGYKDWSLVADQGLFMKLWQLEPPTYSSNLTLRFENGGIHETLTLTKRLILWRRARKISYQFGEIRPNLFSGGFILLGEFFRALKNSISKLIRSELQ